MLKSHILFLVGPSFFPNMHAISSKDELQIQQGHKNFSALFSRKF